MPCYIVQTVSVEFKAKNLDFLIKALELVEHTYTYDSGKNLIHLYGIDIDLEKQEVRTRRSQTHIVNQIKRKYSEVVMTEVAKRKRWVLQKKQQAGKFELRRY